MANMEFLKHVMPKDAECIVAWHRLTKGSKIGPFVHPEEDEYIISGPAKIKFLIDSTENSPEFGNTINYIYIPKGAEHYIINEGDTTEYFVIKVKK